MGEERVVSVSHVHACVEQETTPVGQLLQFLVRGLVEYIRELVEEAEKVGLTLKLYLCTDGRDVAAMGSPRKKSDRER